MRPDSGGAGQYRGGLGLVTEFTNLVDGTWSFTLPPREQCPPWGLFGGGPAQTSRLELREKPDAEWEQIESGRRQVQAGASARIYTGGGGGWGDPFLRDIDQIDADLADELITRAAAEALYGVVVDDVSGRVDRAATGLARAAGTVA